MSTALLHTDNGLQVRTGAARSAQADRDHRQPGDARPIGRNAFEVATRKGNRRWEDTYVTAEAAAEFLGLARPDKLAPYIMAGHLKPYRRLDSQRRLFLRAQVEALVQPDTSL